MRILARAADAEHLAGSSFGDLTVQSGGGTVAEQEAFARALDRAVRCVRLGSADCISIASAPVLDRLGRVTSWPNKPGWQGFDVFGLIHEHVDGDIVVHDDGIAAAYAEWARDRSHSVAYIGIGTGLCGGVVLAGRDGKPETLQPMQLGHTLTGVRGARACVCGRHGCLQALVSARNRDLTFDPAAGGFAFRDSRAFAAAVEALAITCVNLVEIFGVERIIYGGGIGGRYPGLVDASRARLLELLHVTDRLPRVGVSEEFDSVSLRGAYELGLRHAVASPDRDG